MVRVTRVRARTIAAEKCPGSPPIQPESPFMAMNRAAESAYGHIGSGGQEASCSFMKPTVSSILKRKTSPLSAAPSTPSPRPRGSLDSSLGRGRTLSGRSSATRGSLDGGERGDRCEGRRGGRKMSREQISLTMSRERCERRLHAHRQSYEEISVELTEMYEKRERCRRCKVNESEEAASIDAGMRREGNGRGSGFAMFGFDVTNCMTFIAGIGIGAVMATISMAFEFA